MLQYIGDRGMGALSFEPSLRSGEKWADGEIDLTLLERGVEPILSGTPSDVLNEFLEGGASPNGIRPKIIAKEHKGKLYVGSDTLEADEWLIKFRDPDDPKEIGKLEYIYWLMAKEAGLKVSESKLFKSGKHYYFGTKRFDRRKGSRLHLHTLSGLLGVSPLNFAVGYEHFAKAAIALTSDRRSQDEVLRIAAFNVLTCNQDDHSRNVSFMMDKDGKWEVAPAYDLNFHRNRSDEHKMGINGKGKLSIEDLKAFGIELGIGKGAVSNTLEEVKDAVISFKKNAKTVELSKSEITRINSALESIMSEIDTIKF